MVELRKNIINQSVVGAGRLYSLKEGGLLKWENNNGANRTSATQGQGNSILILKMGRFFFPKCFFKIGGGE